MPKRLEENHHMYVEINEDDMDIGQYVGYNGIKYDWIHDGVHYIVKSQEHNKREIESIRKSGIKSYNNSIISEYVGSQLINFIDFKNINAQETMIVKQKNNNKYKFFVACVHLEKNYNDKFKFFPLSFWPSFQYANKTGDEKIARERDNIRFYKMIDWIKTIGSQEFNIDKNEFVDYFYDMFIIDAFLLNWDRNPTNWGLLTKKVQGQRISLFAPLIDQCSTLFAKQDDKNIKEIDNPTFEKEVDHLIKSTKSFFLDENHQKIQYLDYFQKTKDLKLLKHLNEFLEHVNETGFDLFCDSISLDDTYKKDYLYLITRNLELIHEYVNKNPLYKKIIKNNELKR